LTGQPLQILALLHLWRADVQGRVDVWKPFGLPLQR
jgi:hypothetical protein